MTGKWSCAHLQLFLSLTSITDDDFEKLKRSRLKVGLKLGRRTISSVRRRSWHVRTSSNFSNQSSNSIYNEFNPTHVLLHLVLPSAMPQFVGCASTLQHYCFPVFSFRTHFSEVTYVICAGKSEARAPGEFNTEERVRKTMRKLWFCDSSESVMNKFLWSRSGGILV